jgi:hypothetical protein
MTLETEAGSPVMEAALSLLQAGAGLRCRVGLSARVFMREVLGLDDAYIEGTVSTVFLDSEPVDDIDAAMVRDGSRLALSAAMPGLVGAVMRRNSPYASFREGISHGREAASPTDAAGEEGFVIVKLFNSVMRDRGPALLARGVLAPGAAAAELARSAGLPPPAAAEGDDLVELRVLSRIGGAG